MFEHTLDSLVVEQTIDDNGDISIDQELLASKILEILEDQKMAEKLAENAYKKYSVKVSSSQMAEETAKIYELVTSVSYAD